MHLIQTSKKGTNEHDSLTQPAQSLSGNFLPDHKHSNLGGGCVTLGWPYLPSAYFCDTAWHRATLILTFTQESSVLVSGGWLDRDWTSSPNFVQHHPNYKICLDLKYKVWPRGGQTIQKNLNVCITGIYRRLNIQNKLYNPLKDKLHKVWRDMANHVTVWTKFGLQRSH